MSTTCMISSQIHTCIIPHIITQSISNKRISNIEPRHNFNRTIPEKILKKRLPCRSNQSNLKVDRSITSKVEHTLCIEFFSSHLFKTCLNHKYNNMFRCFGIYSPSPSPPRDGISHRKNGPAPYFPGKV